MKSDLVHASMHQERKSNSSRSLSTALIGEFMTVVGRFANLEGFLAHFICVDFGFDLGAGLVFGLSFPAPSGACFSAERADGTDGLFSLLAGLSSGVEVGAGFFNTGFVSLFGNASY